MIVAPPRAVRAGRLRSFQGNLVLVLAGLFCAAILAAPIFSQQISSSSKGSGTNGFRPFTPAPEPETTPEMQALELINRDRTSPECMDETRGRAQPLQW